MRSAKQRVLKGQRDRYNGAVASVALRSFHEVFEGDREGRIKTISLTVQTETINPATGLADSLSKNAFALKPISTARGIR